MEDIKKVKSRIEWFCENKVNAFSPTISPAPKSKTRNEIESIYEGVNYFFKKGVREFVFQKKYMGSYCDIYLCKNLNETYFVSRNGHKITHIENEAAINACIELHSKFKWENLSLVIIQAELLPWHILGKGLIENEFSGYLNAHKNHSYFLQKSNLYKKLELVKGSESYAMYKMDKQNLETSKLRRKYASHIIRQYEAIQNFKIIDLEKYNTGIGIYEEQINHFGKEQPMHFKPFNILKRIYDDGYEEIPNDNLSYSIVNDDDFKTVKIDTKDEMEVNLKPIYEWFNLLTSEFDEGIMIKPIVAFTKNLPPAFKVRNNNYLTMIYGVDFMNEFDSNLYKRNIGKKLDCSINDWMLNWELIKTRYKNISKENYAFKNLVLDRILGEQIENNLDHRL